MSTEQRGTPTRRLIDRLMDGGLDALVQAGRRLGYGWNRIASEVSRESGEYVTGETIRRWYDDADQ